MLGADFFKGKKVTVMGLGLLGRGVGDVAFIAESGAREVVVTDLKSALELKPSTDKLAGYSNIKFVLGEHRSEDFTETDMVLVAAGVPLDSKYLKVVEEAKIPKFQSAALFASLSKIPIIGVTGTRGKSTVTNLIYHSLREITGEEIILGGNIRGVSNLQLLKEVKEDSLAVFELDSWQLQGFGWQKISPQIAVFTNFMEDHLNYYERGGVKKDDAMAKYLNDKKQIFLNQKDDGILITTPEMMVLFQEDLNKIHKEVILADTSVLPTDFSLAMPGEHNLLNAALAFQALSALGLEAEEIISSFLTFKGVEGRLEYVGATEKGVAVYNDNNATTPQAAAVGIEAVGKKHQEKVILIAGGASKALALNNLVEKIKTYCRQVFLIPGNGTEELVIILKKEEVLVEVVPDLKTAFERSKAEAKIGEVILFSPAFASFSQYKNEYERNDDFLEIIKEYV